MVKSDPARKILIIEDEEPLRNILSRKLTREGFEIFEAKNGEEGLRSALEIRPDLILLNLRLPKIDGIEFLRRLRENSWGKGVPVVILTVMEVDDRMIKEILSFNPAHYFVKSEWKIEDVIAKVEEIFE